MKQKKINRGDGGEIEEMNKNEIEENEQKGWRGLRGREEINKYEMEENEQR